MLTISKSVKLSIVALNKQERWDERHDIFKAFITRIKDYQSKNRLFVNLQKCYASNEIRKK